MKKGWLSVNAFVNTPKFDEIYTMLIKSAAKIGITLEKKTNAQLLAEISVISGEKINLPDFVLYWDKDIYLAKMLEKMGLRLFNCADSIRCCDDKILSYITLSDSNIKMPKTYIAPKTFYTEGFIDYDFLPEEIKYPVVIKEAFGSFGKQVYLAKNFNEAVDIIKKFANRPFLIQEFIENSKGKDIRVNVVGNKCVAAMLRYNNNDFRANITNGGNMKKYTPTLAEEETALKAALLLGLDFGGIDILFGEDEPIFCEANSNAHFKNIYDCTGINVADYIMEYINDKVYF